LLQVQENGVKLYIKDESHNPTGSFKARGLAVAVAVAKHLGAERVALPSLGNAGSALARYAREGGIQAFVFFPASTPPSIIQECKGFGAQIKLSYGTIVDCYHQMCKEMDLQFGKGNWINLATLREPFRVEGKKTMAYELWEQLGGQVPSAIVFPTGGGTGVVGMAKAFDEMEALGWAGPERPKWIVVQSQGCAPLVKAFQEGANSAEEWKNPQTLALGLCVPRTSGDFLILNAVRQSQGTILAVSDEDALRGAEDLMRRFGIDACPEGGAAWSAALHLLAEGFFKPGETVVVFNTASGKKYQGESFPHNGP
jgi:threonine synthase